MQYLVYERSILQPRKGYGVNSKRGLANPKFTSIIKASSFQQLFLVRNIYETGNKIIFEGIV